MYKIWVASVAASIGFAGWTHVADADLFSAKGPVIAIMHSGNRLELVDISPQQAGAWTKLGIAVAQPVAPAQDVAPVVRGQS